MGTTRVRLFPDFAARPPLWLDAGLFQNAPISAHLRERLDRWADEWEAGSDPGEGWADEQRRLAWVAEGRELARITASELGPLGYTVVADFDA